MLATTKFITIVVMLFSVDDGLLIHFVVHTKSESASRRRINFFVDSYSPIFYRVKIGQTATVSYHCLFDVLLAFVNIGIYY